MADIGDEELGRKRASRRTKRVRDRAEEEGGKQDMMLSLLMAGIE
jgi:hypothetical protein